MQWKTLKPKLFFDLAEDGVPTSVDFVRCEPSHMVASYTSCNTFVYDIETAKQVIALESNQTSGTYSVCVLCVALTGQWLDGGSTCCDKDCVVKLLSKLSCSKVALSGR